MNKEEWGTLKERGKHSLAFKAEVAQETSKSEATVSHWEAGTKPIPRWDMHFGGLKDCRKDSTAPHNHP